MAAGMQRTHHRITIAQAIRAGTLLAAMLMLRPAHAGKLLDERADMQVVHIDSGYSFDLRFSTPLPADTLLRLLNDTATVRTLTSFVDSVHIRYVDSTAYEIYSSFSYMGYRGQTRFLRRTFHEQDSIAITLETFHHNWRIVPQVKRIEAYYTIEDTDTARLVHFSQTVFVDREVGRVYMRVVRWRLRGFAETLLEEIILPAEQRWRRGVGQSDGLNSTHSPSG